MTLLRRYHSKMLNRGLEMYKNAVYSTNQGQVSPAEHIPDKIYMMLAAQYKQYVGESGSFYNDFKLVLEKQGCTTTRLKIQTVDSRLLMPVSGRFQEPGECSDLGIYENHFFVWKGVMAYLELLLCTLTRPGKRGKKLLLLEFLPSEPSELPSPTKIYGQCSRLLQLDGKNPLLEETTFILIQRIKLGK